MTAVKANSTIQENKNKAFVTCPVTYVVERIGSYWKPILLFNLMTGSKRYSQLRRAVPGITEKVMIQQLKQLQADGLIVRRSKGGVPPYVTYALTRQGMALRPVLYAMAEWAVKHGGKRSRQFMKQLTDFPGHTISD